MTDLKSVASEIREIIADRQKSLGLVFEEDNHIYTMGGRQDYPSVSKILKKFYREFPTDEAALRKAGGDPQAYQEVKQLIELMFDVELQLVRNDQIGTKYAGQTGTASGLPAGQTGRRMGSLASFAGSMSFNTTSGSVSGLDTFFNNEDTDSATQISNALRIYANGSYYYAGTFTNQVFSPVLYKQLVTVAEQRYNAKIRTMVAPTSLRTIISDNIVSSNTSVNRRNVERGDTIQTYEGDFNYTYEVYDSWIMDQAGVSNSIYFLNEEV